jgi:hypothetical protein
MKLGADYLGGVKYESAMIKTHPVNRVGGIFLRTFGPALNTIEKMCASFKFSEIVIHIAPFDPTHAYSLNQYLPRVYSDAKALERLSKKYPNTVLLLSPFCEHNHSTSTMLPVFNKLKTIAPSCGYINSIWKGGRVPGIITELHLENSKKLPKVPTENYTISFDGFGGDGSGDFSDTDIMAILNKYSTARHIRCWNFRFNGKFGHKDETPIKNRRFWPDDNYLKCHHEMMRNREGRLTFTDKMLYKPMADDHGQGGKDNHAMIILPSRGDSIEVLDTNGKVIDIMRRFGDPHIGTPKGNRYYSSRYSYQLAEIARINTGSSLGKFRAPDIITPYTDLALRSNFFR